MGMGGRWHEVGGKAAWVLDHGLVMSPHSSKPKCVDSIHRANSARSKTPLLSASASVSHTRNRYPLGNGHAGQ
jgi:hypothetical protein